MKINPDGAWIGSQDTHCSVNCDCGGELFIGDSYITRCKCGKGYRSQFDLVQYEVGELDPEHQEQSVIDEKLEKMEIEQSVHLGISGYFCGRCKGNINISEFFGTQRGLRTCPHCGGYLSEIYTGSWKRK
jgi:hypothetical protein